MSRAAAPRLTVEELRNLQARVSARPSLAAMRDNPAEKVRRGQKYGNQKVIDQGITFDSKAEHKRWCYLVLLAKAKEITDLQRQVRFELIPEQVAPDGTKVRAMVYVADFTYRTKSGEIVVEDPKGCSTPEWLIKRKLMLHVHGIWVREIRS